MKDGIRLVLAAVLVASCTRSSPPTAGATQATPAAPPAPLAPAPAWVEQDRESVERVGAAWAAWQRGDKGALKQAAQALCPSAHCVPRRASHLMGRVQGAPDVLVTNLGILLLESGSPKSFVSMALGAGAYAKKWRDGRVIVDSPRYRRAYIVDTGTGAVEKVLERQASDGQPSLLDVAPDLRTYVYVGRDEHLHGANGDSENYGDSERIPTGTRAFWQEDIGLSDLTLILPGTPFPLSDMEVGMRKAAPPAVARETKFATAVCSHRLSALCSDRRCTVGVAASGPLPRRTHPPGPHQHPPYVYASPPKYFLTVTDPTPDILDNDAGFGFVDGEHHEVVIVGCDGKVTKRASTAEEEEHHVTAEAMAWRTRLSPQLCSARDAVLPAAACDELEQQGQSHVPSAP